MRKSNILRSYNFFLLLLLRRTTTIEFGYCTDDDDDDEGVKSDARIKNTQVAWQ